MQASGKEQKMSPAPGYEAEEVLPVYFDASALREPPYRIFRLDSEGYRYYYRFNSEGEPEFYPSVTTMLGAVMPTSPFLIKWIADNGKEVSDMKRDLAAAYGTFMHGEFEKLIIGRRYDFDAAPVALVEYMEREHIPEGLFNEWLVKIRKDVLAFAQFIKDYNVRPLAVEIGLVHPTYHYAGCLDLPCIMRDQKTHKDFPAIVDFKSGRKGFWEEHELQLGLYRAMWNENFPEVQIERIFNFSPKDWIKGPTYNLKEQTKSENLQKLPHLLALAAIEDEKRENTLTLVRGVLDLDNGNPEDNVLTLSLAELIKTKADMHDAPAEAAAAPTAEKPVKAQKRPVNEPKAADPVNTPAEPLKPASEQKAEKLPWEDSRADALFNAEMEF